MRDISKDTERRDRIARLDRMADTLDARYRIPGLGIRFGWDSILGLIPGVGDALTAIPGVLIIYEGARQGVRAPVLARMGVNTGLDFVIGGIPLIGDAFDLFFKSHRKNMALLKKEIARMDAVDATRDNRSGIGPRLAARNGQ